MDRIIEKKISVGILAHVDAGKTTLTEKILTTVGALSKAGSVDKGTSVSDSLKVEQERGISVKSSTIIFDYKQMQINLIDTPGHNDFSGEILRVLSVLDLVIMVISATEGIEAQTQFLWNLCVEHNKPVIFFINKMDQVGADIEKVIEEVENQLTKNAILMNQGYSSDEVIELLANHNDEILEQYLNETEISKDLIDAQFQQCANNGDLFPVLAGSAKYDNGIKELLALIYSIQPSYQKKKDANPILQVFKINYHENHRKEIFVKLLQGSIKVKNIIKNSRSGFEEKINYITLPLTNKNKQVEEVSVGDIAILEGLKSARIGDIYGDSDTIKQTQNLDSAFTVQIKASSEDQYPKLAEALSILNQEEPNLNFNWIKEDREFHLDVNGYIHMQILTQILSDRFGLTTTFGEPTIIYKETPVKRDTGYVEYTMPKPCWAVAKFRIEPGKRGSGVTYSSEVSVDKIKRKYQLEIERTIPKALEQGVKGWEVTDIIITLIDGEDHEIHSRPSDFIIATPMGIMNGLQRCGTKLLEPVMAFTLTLPEEKSGRAMSDISKMRGEFDPPVSKDNFTRIEGIIPAATSSNYQMEVSSYTSGKGVFFTRFHSYQECPAGDGKERPYRGISPLDRAKYILKARKAITEGFK